MAMKIDLYSEALHPQYICRYLFGTKLHKGHLGTGPLTSWHYSSIADRSESPARLYQFIGKKAFDSGSLPGFPITPPETSVKMLSVFYIERKAI